MRQNSTFVPPSRPLEYPLPVKVGGKPRQGQLLDQVERNLRPIVAEHHRYGFARTDGRQAREPMQHMRPVAGEFRVRRRAVFVRRLRVQIEADPLGDSAAGPGEGCFYRMWRI